MKGEVVALSRIVTSTRGPAKSLDRHTTTSNPFLRAEVRECFTKNGLPDGEGLPDDQIGQMFISRIRSMGL